MNYISRLIEGDQKLLIPNDVEITGQFTAMGLQSEPGGIAYYVSSVTGKNDNDGKSSLTPVNTITKALRLCRASKGDTIHALPGHIETVSTAGGLTLNKAGIRVFFHGSGNTKATIKFTATASTLLVTAANVELYGPRFLAGIDAIVAAINPQAADFKIYNAEYYDDAAKATLHAIVATSAADRLKIDGWKYVVSTTGTQKHSNIQLAGGDHIELKNIEIQGDFNVAPIEGTVACTNILLENIYVHNTNVGPLPGMNLNATTTGFAKNVKARVASGTVYVTSVAKIQWADDCEGFSTDGYGGEPIGTALISGIEGKVDKIVSDLIIADAVVDKVSSDLIIADTVVDKITSDLIILDVAVDSLISDLAFADTIADVNTIKSDLIVADAIIDTIASDLIVTNAIVDTIASDLVITQSDVKVDQTRIITIASDLVISQSDVKAMNTRTITIASDLVISQSDIKVDQTRIVTIASDLILVDTVVDSIKSDLIVADALIDTIKSDLIISQSDIKIINAKNIHTITVNLAAAALTGTATCFTIANGPILVRHLGLIVTTDIPAGANTLQFTFTATGLAAANLCGVTETASCSDMQLFVVDGVKVTGLVKVTDPGIMVAANEVGMPIVLSSGIIETVFSAGPPLTGGVTLYMQYEKLNTAATVT